jgi:predicted XRE-type DNA-binding protein
VKSRTYSSVWDAIEADSEAASQMKARAALMDAIRRQIERERWTQAQAAKRLGVTQPRISNLMRGRINLFSLDTLVAMANAAGLSVEMKIRRAA